LVRLKADEGQSLGRSELGPIAWSPWGGTGGPGGGTSLLLLEINGNQGAPNERFVRRTQRSQEDAGDSW
jgi:hypothetical protein